MVFIPKEHKGTKYIASNMMNELDVLEMLLIHYNVPHYRYDRAGKDVGTGYIINDRHQICVYSRWIDVPSIEERQYRDDKVIWDAICHYNSYGYDKGLLEISGDMVDTDDGVLGWLTGYEVFKMHMDAYGLT